MVFLWFSYAFLSNPSMQPDHGFPLLSRLGRVEEFSKASTCGHMEK
jgi:hypothetical protein